MRPLEAVSYRTHIQSIGWEAAENDISQWKSDGAMSGTSGMAKRLEGIQIVLVPKGSGMPANNYQEITSVRTEGYISK